MPVLRMLLAMVMSILLRPAVGFRERRRRRQLRMLDPDALWSDGRVDVGRYDRHRWGWGFRPQGASLRPAPAPATAAGPAG